MPNQALYDLLLEAIQQEHPREFTESELATAVQRSNPNFRQLSRAPFVDRVEIAKSLKQPDGEWDTSLVSSSGAMPMLANLRSGMMRRSLPGSQPTTPPPGASELWNFMKPLWEMYRRSRPSGGTPAPWPSDRSSIPDARKDADTGVGPIDELYQARRKKAGSKAGDRPVRIQNAPSIVPDADADLSASVDDRDWCQRRYDEELKKCWEKFPRSQYGECKERATARWDGCNASFRKWGRPPIDELKEYDGYPD